MLSSGRFSQSPDMNIVFMLPFSARNSPYAYPTNSFLIIFSFIFAIAFDFTNYSCLENAPSFHLYVMPSGKERLPIVFV
jgi:hypothetical protein